LSLGSEFLFLPCLTVWICKLNMVFAFLGCNVVVIVSYSISGQRIGPYVKGQADLALIGS